MEPLGVIVGSIAGLVGLCCIKHRKFEDKLNKGANENLVSELDNIDNEDININIEDGNDFEITKYNVNYVNSMLEEYDLCGICNKGYGKNENHIVLECQHTYHIDCYEPYIKERKCFKCNM